MCMLLMHVFSIKSEIITNALLASNSDWLICQVL